MDTLNPGGRYLIIDKADLSQDAFDGLLEEFVTRDGTDYGTAELSLDEKCKRLRSLLSKNEAKIVFDTQEEQVSIVDTASLTELSVNPE